MSRVLLIFLDGVGIGAADGGRNPFFSARMTFLRGMLGGMPSLRRSRISTADASCVPARAVLGMPGLPQSGTGQSALYTGLNTARIIGKHFGPYLYSTLKPVVARNNFFRQALDSGFRISDLALANAFPRRFFEYVDNGARRMAAGMYMAMSSGVPFRNLNHLKAGDGVSADITAARWKDLGHADAPVISPEKAGRNLARIAGGHRLTLFEYFRTDHAGHQRSMALAVHMLKELDEFLRGLYEALDASSTLVIVSSDHGNLEELSVKTHTRNPVPAILFGRGHREASERVSAITDICGVMLSAAAG